MARKQNHGNGRPDESLEAMKQAQTQMLRELANLAQNQTAQLQEQTAILARMAETDKEIAQLRRESEAESARLRRRMDETDRLNAERFARIEALLDEHSRILAELPEAVHRRFGFQPPQRPTTE